MRYSGAMSSPVRGRVTVHPRGFGFLAIEGPEQASAFITPPDLNPFLDGDVDSAPATTGYWRAGYDRLAGWASAPQSDYFSGQVDNVVVYNTALSSGQLAAHFDAAD